MKFNVLFFIVSIFSASAWGSRVKIAPKNKAVAYGNILIEARGRSITVYLVERAHILEEILKLKTPMPIRCLAVVDERFLFAFCRMGSIERILLWDLEIPDIEKPLTVPDPVD